MPLHYPLRLAEERGALFWSNALLIVLNDTDTRAAVLEPSRWICPLTGMERNGFCPGLMERESF